MAGNTEAPKFVFIPRGDTRSPSTIAAIHEHIFPQIEEFITRGVFSAPLGDVLSEPEYEWMMDTRKTLKKTGGKGQITKPKDVFPITRGFLEWHTLYVAGNQETEKAA